MRIKLISAALAVAAVSTAGGVAVADDYDTGDPNQTIADVLLGDGPGFDANWYDYDLVTEAVLLFPDLVAAASDPDAELTIFLPSDDAFRRLVRDLTGSRPHTEQETFDAVASLGLDTVATVLTYHIVAGPPIDYGTATQSNGAVLTTLQGGTIEVDARFTRHGPVVRLIDADPDARNARVVQGDVGNVITNGSLHGVDRVLRPIDL